MENKELKMVKVRSVIEVPEEGGLRKMAEIALMLGMNVEMCGEWLWLSGNSFPVKEHLREAGFRWSNPKRRWYWGVKMRGASWVNWSMDEIRRRFGSEAVA